MCTCVMPLNLSSNLGVHHKVCLLLKTNSSRTIAPIVLRCPMVICYQVGIKVKLCYNVRVRGISQPCATNTMCVVMPMSRIYMCSS